MGYVSFSPRAWCSFSCLFLVVKLSNSFSTFFGTNPFETWIPMFKRDSPQHRGVSHVMSCGVSEVWSSSHPCFAALWSTARPWCLTYWARQGQMTSRHSESRGEIPSHETGWSNELVMLVSGWGQPLWEPIYLHGQEPIRAGTTIAV